MPRPRHSPSAPSVRPSNHRSARCAACPAPSARPVGPAPGRARFDQPVMRAIANTERSNPQSQHPSVKRENSRPAGYQSGEAKRCLGGGTNFCVECTIAGALLAGWRLSAMIVERKPLDPSRLPAIRVRRGQGEVHGGAHGRDLRLNAFSLCRAGAVRIDFCGRRVTRAGDRTA